MDDDVSFDETPFIEPRPDEEAWEAYLALALDHLGADGTTGLSNAQLADVEEIVGAQLPFEVGLLLVMGVPTGLHWRDWRHDPSRLFTVWNDYLLDGIRFDVEHNDFWSPLFGARPDTLPERLDVTTASFASIPPLFPIFGHRAIPLVAPIGATSSDGNPVLSIVQTDVVIYGNDLAEWLHRDFDVPLPMWPADTDRLFPFWSELL